MYSKWQLAAKYLNYYFTASNGRGHGMHSPFIFDFITKVLNDKTTYPAYKKVEALRDRLQKDRSVLQIEDMGAGSSLAKTNRRTVASITSNAAKPKKFGQLLHRMVRAYEPVTILELGTSLGITSSYLAMADPGIPVITIEGAKEVAAVARNNFEQMGLGNVTIHEGNFDMVLPGLLDRLKRVDLAFIDGNHREEPTVRYFKDLLPRMHNDSILVFDDVHWSREMENAWETIRQDPAVRCTVDLFFIGIVFFRREFKEKQDFRIRF
jgi:predicted O-methyltransferase YrrM